MCANSTNVFAPSPVGGPVPKAFFPLTSYNTNSWPLPNYAALNSSTNATDWVPDYQFGTALECSVRPQCAGITSRDCRKA